MDKKYIVAIDGGTQSTKVSIFDTHGTEICSQGVKLRPMHLYGDTRAEHPDDDLWDSLKEACQGVFRKFDGDLADIIGVGLGSIRCCRDSSLPGSFTKATNSSPPMRNKRSAGPRDCVRRLPAACSSRSPISCP